MYSLKLVLLFIEVQLFRQQFIEVYVKNILNGTKFIPRIQRYIFIVKTDIEMWYITKYYCSILTGTEKIYSKTLNMIFISRMADINSIVEFFQCIFEHINGHFHNRSSFLNFLVSSK